MPVAVAATAAATLLLTACGGGDSKADDKIPGTESSAPAPASPSPSPSPSEAAGRPKITLPPDVKNVFEGWTTGDPVKDAILTDVSAQMNATDEAITSDAAEPAGVIFYNKGDALIGAGKWIADFKTKGLTITGTTHYYNPKIQLFDDKSAGVGFCTDESKAFTKDRKTGKVNEDTASGNSYVTYSLRVDKNAQGVWQTTKLASQRGDKTCTP
ncbi:hypothetical protein J7F03_30490 [Streptomyces sp. ISL-43]|uniref:hypothetical protein n=1 Tax=Streptomyces sp. ISL-43 TaxID=2819183 RepID=UPI001BE8EA14|nr:hypothetical protein [Streptomyces sp. ISL-43]MBT2451323.1 hypothetical protein [Streptomyces sp. ISL-43]